MLRDIEDTTYPCLDAAVMVAVIIPADDFLWFFFVVATTRKGRGVLLIIVLETTNQPYMMWAVSCRRWKNVRNTFFPPILDHQIDQISAENAILTTIY